jgi:hypothetical protein
LTYDYFNTIKGGNKMKKNFFVQFTAVLLMVCGITFLISPPAMAQVSPGDIDGDGIITLNDLIEALKVSASADLAPGIVLSIDADINGDGKIGLIEAIDIMQILIRKKKRDSVFLNNGLMVSKDRKEPARITVGSATVWKGDTARVDITVDDATGITGAAFTIVYDTDKLDMFVTSDFFDTFTEQGFDYYDGMGTDGKVDGFDSPMVTNEVAGTGTIIAATNAATATGGTNTTLFTLEITAAEDVQNGETYDITIIPTTLNNTAAGYDATGEQIDPLIEARDDGSFSALMTSSDLSAAVTNGTLTIGVTDKGDLDGNGYVQIIDMLETLMFILGDRDFTEEQLLRADMNEDGKIDVFDVVAMWDIEQGY